MREPREELHVLNRGSCVLIAATAATEGMRSIREVGELRVSYPRRLPRPRECAAFARLASCVCPTRGDCRDRGNAQHSRGWRVACVLPAATAATEGMRSIREVSSLPSLPALKNETALASFYQKFFCCFHTEMLFQRKHRLLSGVRTLCRILGFLIAPIARMLTLPTRKKAPAYYIREPFRSLIKQA